MNTSTQSTERNEKPRRGERRGSGGERPRMFIAASRQVSITPYRVSSWLLRSRQSQGLPMVGARPTGSHIARSVRSVRE